jgi:hypothetical protein
MNKKILALCTLLITAVLLFFLLPSDEKEIRHNLELLAEYSSTTGNDGILPTLTKSRSVSNLCTEDCAINIESFHVKQHLSRKDISDHIVLLKKMLPDTRFTFDDIQIDFHEENRARINATLSLNSKTEQQNFTDAYELKSSVVKVDGDWLFSSFTVVEFMER